MIIRGENYIQNTENNNEIEIIIRLIVCKFSFCFFGGYKIIHYLCAVSTISPSPHLLSDSQENHSDHRIRDNWWNTTYEGGSHLHCV